MDRRPAQPERSRASGFQLRWPRAGTRSTNRTPRGRRRPESFAWRSMAWTPSMRLASTTPSAGGPTYGTSRCRSLARATAAMGVDPPALNPGANLLCPVTLRSSLGHLDPKIESFRKAGEPLIAGVVMLQAPVATNAAPRCMSGRVQLHSFGSSPRGGLRSGLDPLNLSCQTC